MGRIGDLAPGMHTAGLILVNHMLYTISIDALPAEYEVEARSLTSRDSIGREEIISGVRERHHRVFGSRKTGSNADHAIHAGDSARGGCGKGGGTHAELWHRGAPAVCLDSSLDYSIGNLVVTQKLTIAWIWPTNQLP